MKLKDWSWLSVISLIYKFNELILNQFDIPYVQLVHMYQFAPFELAMRKSPYRDCVRKMQPTPEEMSAHFITDGGDPDFGAGVALDHNVAMRMTFRHAVLLGAHRDSEDPFLVHVGALEQYIATTMGTFAMELGDKRGPLASARYLARFINFGRDKLTPDQLAEWEELEMQRGLGIILGHLVACTLDPTLTAEEFVAHHLRKYGMPDAQGIHSCHWCGCAPCRCGGIKGGGRKVTLEEALSRVGDLGPMDCWVAMLLDYSLGRNPALCGGAYGELRSTMEVNAEAVAGDLSVKRWGDLDQLGQVLGPFWHEGQMHLQQLRQARVHDQESALAQARPDWSDRAQWVFAGSRFFNIPRGIELALRFLAERLGVELEMPPLPEIPAIYR